MQILVLGGGGMLASTLVPFMQKNGVGVEVSSMNPKFSTIRLDPFDIASVSSTLRKRKFDFVLNLIGLTSVDECQRTPSQAIHINSFPSQVFRQVIDLHPHIQTRWVQISTDHLYDGHQPSKESEVRVVNYYAASKLAGELHLRNDMDLVLRTNFVGPSENKSRQSLTDWVIQCLSSGEGSVPVLRDVSFSPLTMRLVSEFSLKAMKFGLSGVFNLGATGSITKAQFDRRFAESMNLPFSRLEELDLDDASFLKAPRPRNMSMDSSFFSAAAGINMPTIEEVLQIAASEHRGEA